MPKRTLTDHEIALIKAMISRGMKNKDIQFFFNRPDRPVNSGRISDIRAGTYSDSANIAEADVDTVEEFIKHFQSPNFSATINVPPDTYKNKDSFLSKHGPTPFFVKKDDGHWYYRYGETETSECKQNFGFKHPGKWLRAIAALANNKGGHILFGVKDKQVKDGVVEEDSFRVYGMNSSEFNNADPADISKLVRSTFDPTPSVEASTHDVEGKQVGCIHVHQHKARPVIALRNVNEIKEGDIYFRYPGISTRIKYSDLRAMLDERDRSARKQILPMVEKLLARGPDATLVADLKDGTLSDGRGDIYINEDLLKQISFIKKGEFSEESGAPALRLVGDVKSMAPTEKIVEREFITIEDLFRDFMALATASNVREYVRCAVEGTSVLWAPIHFFAQQGGMSPTQLADYIYTLKASSKRKDLYAQRAKGEISAFRSEGGAAADYRNALEAGDLPTLDDAKSAASLGRAVTSLSAKPAVSLESLLSRIQEGYDIIDKAGQTGLKSPIRRALARLDELYYCAT